MAAQKFLILIECNPGRDLILYAKLCTYIGFRYVKELARSDGFTHSVYVEIEKDKIEGYIDKMKETYRGEFKRIEKTEL